MGTMKTGRHHERGRWMSPSSPDGVMNTSPLPPPRHHDDYYHNHHTMDTSERLG